MQDSSHHLVFRGSDEAFAAMLISAGIKEPVEHRGINWRVVRMRTGANINWWPSTGTIHVDGKPGADRQCKEVLRRQPGVNVRTPKRKHRPAAVDRQGPS